MNGVDSKWQKARDLINQQSDILIQELYHVTAKRDEYKRRMDELNWQLAEKTAEYARKTPPAVENLVYLRNLEARKAELETEVRKCREYMRLKDQSKTKVEMQRDSAQRALASANNIIVALQVNAKDVSMLKVQNDAQAKAFAEKDRENVEFRKRLEVSEDAVRRLQEVLALGRKGLQAERDEW